MLILGFLIFAGAGLSGRLNELVPFDTSSASANTSSVSAQARLHETADQDVNAAIQQVIQRSNDEQVQAIASHDSSLMADTVTSDHYQELVKVNQNLLDDGVSSINLVALEWGAVAVDGSTATATTYETWRTVFSDGTTDQSRDRNDYTLVLDSGSWKIKTDDHPDAAQPGVGVGASTPPQTQPFPFPDNQNTSHNWSGYAATGGTYTSVTGTWSVPQFSADGPAGIDAAWVGIGGVRSRDLIQAGTQQTVTGSGRTQYEAWIEMLPRSSRPVPLQVHAGDSVTVSITEQSTDQWLIHFSNNTTGQTYDTTQQYTSSHSSAEWVEEAPSAGRGGVLPLDNFGTIQFSDGSAVKNGQTVDIAGAGARGITMVGNNDQALAVPTVIGQDGASFSVARTDAPANQAGTRTRGFGGIPFPIAPVIPGGS
jgi:peptidase A4-like protein